MNMGNPSRSLALAEVQRGDYLPVDARAWEQGVRFDEMTERFND